MTPQVLKATSRQQCTVLGESSRGGQGRNCGCCLPMPFDHQGDFFSTRKAIAMMESRHWTAALQPVRCSSSSSSPGSSRSRSARRPLALLLLLPMLAVLLPLAFQRSAVVADGLASEEEGAASAGPPSGEEKGSSSLPRGRSGKHNYWRTAHGRPAQTGASSFTMRKRSEAEGVQWRRLLSVEKDPFVIAFENTAGPVNNTFSGMPQEILTRLIRNEVGSPSPPISPTPLKPNELPPPPVRESNVLDKGEVVVLNPWGRVPMTALSSPIKTVESVSGGSFFHIPCGLKDDVKVIPQWCIETLRALPPPEPGRKRYLIVQAPFWGALPLLITMSRDVTLPTPAAVFFDCLRKGPLDDMERGLCHGNMQVSIDPGLYDRYVTDYGNGIHISIKKQLKSRCYASTRIRLAGNEELIIEGDETYQEQRMRGNYHLYSSPDIFVVIPSDMTNEALDVKDSEILKQPDVVNIGRHVLKISPSEQPMKFICEGEETAVSLKDGVDVQLNILPVTKPYLPPDDPSKEHTTLIIADREGHSSLARSDDNKIGEDGKVVRRIRCGTKGGSPDAIKNCVSFLPKNLSTRTHEVIISATDRGDLLKLLGAALKTAKNKEATLGVFKLLLAKRLPDKSAADYIGPDHQPQNRGWDPALLPNFQRVTGNVWRRKEQFCFDFLVIKFYADIWQPLPGIAGGDLWLPKKEGEVTLTFGLTNNIGVKTSTSRRMGNDLQLPPVRSFRLKKRPVGSATARPSLPAFPDVQVVCGSTPWAVNSNVAEHTFTAVPVSLSVNHHDLYEKAMLPVSGGRAE